MIVASLNSASASWLSWTVLTSLLASIGGVLVFCGLWMEKKAGKKEYLNVDDFRSQKLKAERGWQILMLGIGLEIVTAFALTVRGELEMKQTRTNVANIDPRNANISDMSASAILFVKGRDFNDLTNWDARRVARMTLCKNDVSRSQNFDTLNADNFTKKDFIVLIGGFSDSREYGIRFHSFNFNAARGVETPVKAIDDVNLLRMDINFLPHGAEISGGAVELVVNNIHKMFNVFPQADTNPPDGTPGYPYMVIATNVVQASEK